MPESSMQVLLKIYLAKSHAPIQSPVHMHRVLYMGEGFHAYSFTCKIDAYKIDGCWGGCYLCNCRTVQTDDFIHWHILISSCTSCTLCFAFQKVTLKLWLIWT